MYKLLTQSRDHFIRHNAISYILVLHWNGASISNRFQDIRPERMLTNTHTHTNKHDESQYLLAEVINNQCVPLQGRSWKPYVTPTIRRYCSLAAESMRLSRKPLSCQWRCQRSSRCATSRPPVSYRGRGYTGFFHSPLEWFFTTTLSSNNITRSIHGLVHALELAYYTTVMPTSQPR